MNTIKNIMSEDEAKELVATWDDDTSVSDETLEEVFAALAGRPADDQDREEGLFSHCVQLAAE